MSAKDEQSLLKEFDRLVSQCRKNIAGDSPSRDDVIVIFASELLKAKSKQIAELYHKLDISETRVAKFTKSKSIGVVNE